MIALGWIVIVACAVVYVAGHARRQLVAARGIRRQLRDLVGMTGPGRKIELSEADPRVGFQVDTSIEDGIYAWESVHGNAHE